MGYSVFCGHHFAQAREDVASAADALALMREWRDGNAVGIFAVDSSGKQYSIDTLAAFVAAGNQDQG
jgi:hypothetical protein